MIGGIDGAPPLVLQSVYPNGLPDTEPARRNEIVGGYILEPDQLCSSYLQSLTRYQRTNNLIFGTLSTTLGALGAAFTQASVVRPLSAAAAIASGERAEIDADSFARQTAEVIASAIKNSRLRSYGDIVETKFPKSITAWPLKLALADVENYHLKCSLHEGLAEASASISATAPSPLVFTPGDDVTNTPDRRGGASRKTPQYYCTATEFY
jgi:hypothetical protein